MGTNASVLPPGQTLGRYVIRRTLGSGAFGAVYEALQQPLGKRVALKVLHASQAESIDSVRRFQAEAEATAQLRHPNIVDVLDVGEAEGLSYIAMEFLEGEVLTQRIQREGRLSPRAAADLLLPVCSAVATVHDAGIVHRDLKPDNLFLSTVRPGKVQPKLLDFGIAKVRESQHAQTRTGAMMGTLYYMSPEQARESKDVDGRSDQWALGVILFQCLTGRRPFPGSTMIDVLNGIIGSPVPTIGDVPGELEAVIRRSLQKSREARFASVRGFASALLPFASPAMQEEWASEFAEHAEDLPAITAVAASGPMSGFPRAPSAMGMSASFTAHEVVVPAPVGASNAPATRSGMRALTVACGALGAMILVAAGGFLAGKKPRAPAPSAAIARAVTARPVEAAEPAVVVNPPVAQAPVIAAPAVRAPVVAAPVATEAPVAISTHHAGRSVRHASPVVRRRPVGAAPSVHAQPSVTRTGIAIH